MSNEEKLIKVGINWLITINLNPLVNVINLDRLVQNLPFLCYNFNDFKKELIQMNEEKGVNKTVINCLVTLFATLSKSTYKIRTCVD